MKRRTTPVMVVASLGLLLTSCAQKAPETSRTPNSVEGKGQDQETPWTTWSKKGKVGGLLVLKHIRENLLNNNLHDPHVNYQGHPTIDCSKQNMDFRSADGSCYDSETPHVGAANTAFGRNVPPEFIDKEAEEKLMIPNPKVVSEVFFTRNEFKPVPFLNMIAASWIQFMNHDWLSHGRNQERNPHQVPGKHGANYEVERTKENHLADAQYKKAFQKVTLNEVTHWWDGSQIYGSSQNQQNLLRSFSKGRMTTVKVNGRELLPKDQSLNVRHNKQNQGHEVTGFRDNMWVGLSMLHHLFVKEHNAIADMLYKEHVKKDQKGNGYVWNSNGFLGKVRNAVTRKDKNVKYFNEKELDEHIFQTARLINSAVMAKIHTVEWTPAILPNKTLRMGMYGNWYGLANPQTWSRVLKHIPGLNKTDWFGLNEGYLLGGIVGQKRNDYGVPFSITEEFTSVYRLHSLLPEELELKTLQNKKKVTKVPLDATRNEKSYEYMSKHNLDDLFYSFGTQHPGQLVLNNFPKFMQDLKIPGLGSMDLAMVDVLRDRERGVPRYNQFRRAIGLKPIARYSDFFLDGQAKTAEQKKIIQKFLNVYGKDANGNDNVELIDLLVGTSAEEVRPEKFGFGETMFQIFIVMASRRLMADPYFTDKYKAKYYTKAGLKWIDQKGTMKKVILRHMPELRPHLKGVRTAFDPWNP